MNKREAKRESILCHGLEVMKANGYNGTSVKDIVDAAAVPKGSFYNYFASKERFAVEALEWVAQQSQQTAMACLTNQAVPPLQRLLTFYANHADQAGNCQYKMGCFLGNMCQEMSDSNEVIRLKVRQILHAETRVIAQVLQEAMDCGDLVAEVPSSVLAEFIFNAWEGALMRMKGAKCREPLDAFLKVLPSLLR